VSFVEGDLYVGYPEFLVAPMREELTRLGVEELRSAEDVDRAVRESAGTLMIVVNSVCGCAAGKARPGIARALQHAVTPDRLATVFAGADVEATERARGYFAGMPPSSPSVALLQNGQLVYMLQRSQIEMRSADEIAAELQAAFDNFCAKPASV
jgi:putative YphP/YqiW family bacilliredoxin